MFDRVFCAFISLLCLSVVAVNGGYSVNIVSTGSAILGARVNFTATLYYDNKVAGSGEYKYEWADNTRPQSHSKTIETKGPHSTWSVEYPENSTKPGSYDVTVKVHTSFINFWNVPEKSLRFNLTDDLGGMMALLQENKTRPLEFVSTKTPVTHRIQLRPNDAEFVAKKVVYVQTYWFQNCTYLGATDGLNYLAEYPAEDEYYDIEALVVGSFEPKPVPTTTTTTTTTTTPKPTTTTTTTPAPTTTTTTTTTTAKPTTTTKAATVVVRRKRDAAAAPANATVATTAAPPAVVHSSARSLSYFAAPAEDVPVPPFNCSTKTVIRRDPKKVYGYFQRRLVSKAPVMNFTTNGNNWLKHGDLLNMEVKVKGSPPLEYCTVVRTAPYNATGNETCMEYFRVIDGRIPYRRYFSESKTVLFFIRNVVSQTLNQVTVNIYEAKVQPQLSVVVVPVTFSLVAIILIIFGVSYYLQSRNRFTVEVADFNFGETQSVDMEYKTFQQRLIESLREVMPRRHQRFVDSVSELGPEDSPGPSGVAGEGDDGAPAVASAGADNDGNFRYETLN